MDAGTAEAWLISFTTQLRTQLPAGNFIITHARTYVLCSNTIMQLTLADSRCSLVRILCSSFPYLIANVHVVFRFTPNKWPGGGYLKVHQQVGSLIDWVSQRGISNAEYEGH